MTWIKPVQESPPPQSDVTEPAGSSSPGSSTGRLVGVDLARALAVFGMYAVHVGPREPMAPVKGPGDWLLALSEGRASALFATLAGFSLLLIAGRREPKTGLAGRQAKARIAIRAVVLLAFGSALTMVFGDVVILAFYGVYFLLALPLVRLSAKKLAIIAAVSAAVLPQLAFGLKVLLSESFVQSVNAYDPLERLCGVGVVDLLLTGFYPTITWMPFVIAGMAVARPDLAAAGVWKRLAGLGAALITLGYGLSWLLSRMFGNHQIDWTRFPKDSGFPKGSGSFPKDAESFGSGVGESLDAAWTLLGAGPHTGTTFDILGSVGIAITVLVGAVTAMDRLPRLRRLATPVIAVGTMSLTAYVGHFVAMSAFSIGNPDAGRSTSSLPLIAFIIGATVFAATWSRFFRRGPLEYLLNEATRPAKFIR